MDKGFLQSLRRVMDPVADGVVKQMMENNQADIINRTFLQMDRNNSKADGLPSYLKDYINNTSQLPTWIDQKKIKKAQELYLVYGLEISMVLFFKSLPQSYCCAKGAKVLHATGRLSRDNQKFTRRVIETSQFVMNVLSKRGFEKNGSAIITIQKVRLIHAAIRYYLKREGWDSEAYGEPINQEDMAGTLMSFSALVIEGLEMMNIHWTNEEKDAFIHCWNVAGYILGVKPDLLPQNSKEALALGYEIFNDQKGQSQEGTELTEALTTFVKYIVPGNVFDDLGNELVAYFLGPELSEYVGIKKDETFLNRKLPTILKFMGGVTDEVEDHSLLVRAVTKPFSKMILNGILCTYNDYKGSAILIPPSLQENWKLGTGWETTISGPAILGRRLAIQKKINTLK